MSLTPHDVARIAHLARLELTAGEAAHTLDQLNGIFGLIEQLQSVDTAGVEPLAHPLAAVHDIVLRLRDDAVTEGGNPEDSRAANQASAPSVRDGLFLVPKVIE